MKTTLKIRMAAIIMGFLTTLLFGGSTNNAIDIPALIKSGALIIDVRSEDEFSSGHIEHSVNIPHNMISTEIIKHALGKEKTIIVYCHAGGRATAAEQELKRMGYTNVVNGINLQNMKKILSNSELQDKKNL